MSKLKRAQSKTGKTGIVEKVIVKEKIDDKPKEHGLRATWGADSLEEGRPKVKRKYNFAKRGKGPDSDSSK